MKNIIIAILMLLPILAFSQETKIFPIMFKSAPGVDYIFKSNASGLWEIAPASSIVADGSETIINAGGDITVTGTGTSGDPYVVSFTETTTSLSLATNTLTYTDENGATTNIDLSNIPAFTKTISGDIVTDNGNQTYTINETTTTLSWNEGTRTLTYTDEDGATTNMTIEKADIVSYTYVDDAIAAQTAFNPTANWDQNAEDIQVSIGGIVLAEGATRDYTLTASGISLNRNAFSGEVVQITWIIKS